eukprot:4171625-Prymnesium_polylepis.1
MKSRAHHVLDTCTLVVLVVSQLYVFLHRPLVPSEHRVDPLQRDALLLLGENPRLLIRPPAERVRRRATFFSRLLLRLLDALDGILNRVHR